jgi:hypothetical protein
VGLADDATLALLHLITAATSWAAPGVAIDRMAVASAADLRPTDPSKAGTMSDYRLSAALLLAAIGALLAVLAYT